VGLAQPEALDVVDFKGKVVLVTGGGAGIGRAIVSAFTGLGATVICLEISSARADELRAYAGDGIVVVEGDASDTADVSRLAAMISERYGRLDVFWRRPVGTAMIRTGGPTCR
jgi:3-oxoacyl-[acyl-carrier protein] reductase